ncbi:MAG: RraA family protein [Phycisphaerae bacterium]
MTHSHDDDLKLLELFEGCRVADVRDGMDAMMLHASGSMSPKIRPLWRTRAVGIARTVRYLPYRGDVPAMSPEEYRDWVGWYYREVCTYPWIETLREGDFAVLDLSGVDAGLMGSENTLAGLRRGVRGYVSSDGVRDTDEIILQKVPFWSAYASQSMVQARLQYDAMDVPICVGGVTVNPGDVVAADGDGVIVVPRDVAPNVAAYAREEHARDRKTRAEHYNALGIRPDGTVGGA